MASGDALLAQSIAQVHIESWARRGSEIELHLTIPTEAGRRCRIETSSDLVTWSTSLVTEPSGGSSLAAVVSAPAATPRFFRTSLFDWEELRAELQAARQRWTLQSLVVYHFEFHWQCVICHPLFRDWVRVDVRDNTIDSVTSLTTGEIIPRDRWVQPTVDELFDWIEDQLEMHPEYIQIGFDPVSGSPISGFVDRSSLLNDEEMGFELRSLSP